MSLSQLYQPPRTPFSYNTYHLLLSFCEYCKVLILLNFYRTPPKAVVADVFKNRCSYKFRKLHRKPIVLGSIFKNSQACNFIKKRLQNSCFPVKFAKILRAPFLTEHLWWLLLHLRWLRLYFLKKVLLNSYFATLSWRTNIFFFSTRCLMYTKWKVLVCL